MSQKTTWMRYLIIGINLGVFMIVGCGKKSVELVSSAEYVYTNNMNLPITIIAHDYDSFKSKNYRQMNL